MTLPNAATSKENVPFYFLHIPKTAGSSLNLLLRKLFPESKILPYWGWHQLLSLTPEELTKYQVYSGHFYSYFHKLVPTPLKYFTFLRDPIDRALSHYGHVVIDDTHYLHKRALELGNFSAYIRDEALQFTVSNFQVRALALDADPFLVASSLTKEQIESYELERVLESIKPDKTDDELLAIAKQNLDQFCFVGITERFEESLMLLCHIFGWTFESNIESTNINSARIVKESLSADDIKLLNKLNQADLELYEYAKNVFNNNLKQIYSKRQFISYSQNFEDVILWRALKHVESGFYIDVGAWSPDIDSVTRSFYEVGWRGINIEPNPVHYESYKHRRPQDINLCLALADQAGEAEMFFVSSSGLSSLSAVYGNQHAKAGFGVEPRSVVVETLNAIWSKYVNDKEVHFLKIDVEGFERQVLKGNDWEKHRPWILVIEATEPNSTVESYHSWEPILISNSYMMVYADGLNRYYLANEHMDLLNAFKYPPNVFDGFLPAAVVDANEKVKELEFNAHKAELKAHKAELMLHDLNTELTLIKNSLSWSLTRPLRVFKKIIKNWYL